MDPRDEREIEAALAGLASDAEPDAMPADVASRFDTHLHYLLFFLYFSFDKKYRIFVLLFY